MSGLKVLQYVGPVLCSGLIAVFAVLLVILTIATTVITITVVFSAIRVLIIRVG